ncbi:alkaline phosphatase family protein [Winogradskyella undariae]|uniref:alkaline phosphatase family protein n=1 Tax=Winogradskyella undariae TaxID=1285465 RepID=UPI00156B3CA0|nr:alkaline phosphatase family protein [Winogradskyella undariae]NRR93275.1 alkaline phosphatase family protein [Winogradskyella undariae]
MKKKSKVLLIGWDAADWKIIGPLLAKGQMPSLKKLIDKGVYGNMATMNPPYSPMLWSTVATGKTPDKHGVLGFLELMPDLKGVRPVTVKSRKSRALWNIFHNQGLKSNLVGWWPSFPAEPINGVVVTDKFQKVNINPNKKSPIVEGTIHPESLVESLHDLRVHPSEITEAHILPFIPKAGEIDQDKDQSLQTFSKIMAENVSLHAAATNLMRTTDWDFMGVYYDFIDHFCHAFMKFHPPKLGPIPKKIFELYNDCVLSAYRFQDMMLGRMLELTDDDTTIIVMSDHGYESGNKRILEMPKYQAAPSLEHRQFGMFVAAGPNIKKNEKIFGLGLVDVAPTILHMFNLPIGKDMDGKIALDIFENIKPPKFIDSWETVAGDFGEHSKNHNTDSLSDQEAMQQLIDLGYIDRPDEKLEVSILKTKCDLKYNLARVYLGKKDYENAKLILLELIEEKEPVDVIPYYMDLLTISINEEEFDKAEIYLNELRVREKKFEINTYFSEAKILLSKNKVNAALELLVKAKNNKPNGEVWFQIGKIYTRLDQLEDAKAAFENALTFEIDNAHYHQAFAVVLIRLEDYEEAAEHALTAIELIKYFPDAHYTLGEALEKLGDTENAKKAYETAAKLKVKTYHRAEKAIENIQDKIIDSIAFKDKSDFKYRKDQIVIVSGLPRSGTSLMMQMLDKGGINALTDTNRKADASNPKGYLEYAPVMALHHDNSWLGEAQNKSLKVVAPLLKFLDPKYRYKVVFMTRDLNEVIKSQQKMIGKDVDVFPVKLYETYKKHLKQVETWKDREPSVELIYVDYKESLYDTEDVVKKVISFIGEEAMNVEQMKSCVDKTLYRNKV